MQRNWQRLTKIKYLDENSAFEVSCSCCPVAIDSLNLDRNVQTNHSPHNMYVPGPK